MSDEPIIHSHLEDILPKDHPLAYVSVRCKNCDEGLHCRSNECMQTWLETKWGNYCTKCYPIRAVLNPPRERKRPKAKRLALGGGTDDAG